ncbi:MAG: 4-alpha-glucanotransferase [Acidimicrobiia bacterium]|nr:4-alpha-glucanotransferase [Acidimicrobiia bacterium]
MTSHDPFRRTGGILLHPTSLTSPYGIGDIGPAARDWVRFVASTDTGIWQILPLGPTGFGDSPYQCFSSFAGNPYLISPDDLLASGVLTEEDLASYPEFPAEYVDYGPVIIAKLALLDRAFDNFRNGDTDLESEFAAFRAEHEAWIDDFGLFMSLKDEHDGQPWTEWDRPLRLRHVRPIRAAQRRLAVETERHAFRQFLFFRQWSRVRALAAELGVMLVGDLPVYVAADSADVWANQALFRLNAEGLPAAVAGVPPDYFSETGQLWGNPLYDWEAHADQDYEWWASRVAATLAQVDVVRIDHFRAFADYWEIPADSDTAIDGRWVDGPGDVFFEALRRRLGVLPIIAEDLGDLSPAVPELRERLELPGMKILQFAFDAKEQSTYLPHGYPDLCVAYTGTHDNNTVNGWYDQAPDADRDFARRYLSWDGTDPAGRFIEAIWESPAMYAIAPLQDFLRLGEAARMNVPGVAGGNWQWRIPPGTDLGPIGAELEALNERHRR